MNNKQSVASASQQTTTGQVAQSAPSVTDWLELVIEDTDTYWWQMDLPTNRLYYSPNAERILGQPPAPSLADNLAFLHPDDQELPAQAIEQAVRTGQHQFSYQVRSLAQANQLRWFEVTGKILPDSQGQPTRVVGRAQNITPTKQAQSECQQSEARAQYLLELSDAMRSLADPVSMQLTATRLALDYFKADRAYYCEVEGSQVTVRQHAARPDLPPIPPSYDLDQWPSLKALLLAGKPVVVSNAATSEVLDEPLKQLCARLQIQAYIQVPLFRQGQLVAKFCLTQDQPRAWTSSDSQLATETAQRTWDVAQRARTEAALRQSEAQYRTLFESIDEGFCLIELLFDEQQQPYDHRFVQINPAFERLTGLRGLVGQTARQRAPQLASHWHELYAQVITSGQSLRCQQRSPLLERIFDVYICPLGDASANLVAVVFSDITQRQQAQQALQLANQRKDEFLAMLAHELRNPMAILHGTLALLNEPGGPPQDLGLDQALGLMSREVSHLNRLVDDLLDVSRMSRGKIELRLEAVELVGLVQQSLAATHAEFRSRQQVLISELSHQPLWVRGDATRLTQIVRNLLTNANKYTPQGGQVQVSLQAQAGQVMLRVKDSGIGLAAEQLEAIFEVFVQVTTSLDRPQGGLGLGLAVVKQLVEQHGGRVVAQSPGLGQGSEFIVSLPALDELPPRGASGGRALATAKAPVRLLLVDDNADLVLVTALALRAHRYEVHTCQSGEEALGAVARLQPDAVLLDLGMPGLDGYETARRLRQLPWGRRGVIVALSGYGSEEDKKRTRAGGFDGHLLKPLPVEQLGALLAGLLPLDVNAVAQPLQQIDESARQRTHDLRSNFAIIGLAVSQLREAPGEAERQELLAMLERNVHQATQLVTALLA